MVVCPQLYEFIFVDIFWICFDRLTIHHTINITLARITRIRTTSSKYIPWTYSQQGAKYAVEWISLWLEEKLRTRNMRTCPQPGSKQLVYNWSPMRVFMIQRTLFLPSTEFANIFTTWNQIRGHQRISLRLKWKLRTRNLWTCRQHGSKRLGYNWSSMSVCMIRRKLFPPNHEPVNIPAWHRHFMRLLDRLINCILLRSLRMSFTSFWHG